MRFLKPILLACIIFPFFSCENSSPTLGTVKHIILYDYKNTEVAPQERLGVYVEVLSDPKRINNIIIYSQESGYTWTIDNPLSITNQNNNTIWIGSSNIRPARDSLFPTGQYTLTYTDLAQRQVEHFFYIDSVENSSRIDSEDFIHENIALYNGNGSLLYYGNDTQFKDGNNAKEVFPDIAFRRSVFVNSDETKAIIQIPIFFTDGE